jgi:nucleotidyltransferase substrate binding protein (TIGR01987 family)
MSLERAVERLREALAAPATPLNRDAAIQRFEFCFELGWKHLQHTLRFVGIECSSPRACLKAAFRQGWLEEEPWLSMLTDRNLTSHTYDEALAQQVYGRLRAHLPTLEGLLRNVPE